MTHPIRVAFIGAVKRPSTYDFKEMAKNYAAIVDLTRHFESAAFENFDASQTYLAGSPGERRIVFFTDEERDPVAAFAAARQASAKVFVFTEAYRRGNPHVLPDNRAPEATRREPLTFALDSVSVENIWRLLA